MKALQLYLEEIFTTPTNTLGMGNITMPTNDQIGTDLIVFNKSKKVKKKNKKNKNNEL